MAAIRPQTGKPRSINQSGTKEKLIKDIHRSLEDSWQEINDLKQKVEFLSKWNNGTLTGKQNENYIKNKAVDNELYSVFSGIAMS